ncbi:MAG: rod shape-determining protein [Candidatus Calescibacterium sp.]|nr:rod shape-determining protein [Candidatus Calescibacterium sp.]MCX7758108.1 rod shape-determining protein [bacterium]
MYNKKPNGVFSSLNQRIGIDLGTNSVLVYVKGKGIVLKEPSVVAIDKKKGNVVLAVGEEAKEMIGRTPSHIVAERPIRDGVIASYEAAEAMIKFYVNKVKKNSLIGYIFKPIVAVCIPAEYNSVEERVIKEAVMAAGARDVYIIEEPMAAAIGANLKVNSAKGNMIVDIGGGTTDVAVISLGGIVVKKTIKVAGDKMDEAISKYIRKNFNLLIGEQTAERIKISIGTVISPEEDKKMEVKGRDLFTGLPKSILITSRDTIEALWEPVSEIVDTVKSVLEMTPPELASDIIEEGITLTGGGALLKGLDIVISKSTGIKVNIPDDPIACVAIGTGRFAESL